MEKTWNNEMVFELLSEISDPEIPVISIVDLGVLRKVKINESEIEIIITPTYSGCPAMKQMEDDIKQKLIDVGFTKIEIKTVYSPAWTTDWLNDAAKTKLFNYGIAPPEKTTSDKSVLSLHPKKIVCPKCKSTTTKLVSQFGSTACKAFYQCQNCLEPFDYFKCI